MAKSKKSPKSIPAFEHSFDQQIDDLKGFALCPYESILLPGLNGATTVLSTSTSQHLRDDARALLRETSTSKKYATKFRNLPLMTAFVSNDLFTKVWLKVGKTSAICISRVAGESGEKNYRVEKERFEQKRLVIPVPLTIVMHGDQGIVTNVNHEQEYLLTCKPAESHEKPSTPPVGMQDGGMAGKSTFELLQRGVQEKKSPKTAKKEKDKIKALQKQAAKRAEKTRKNLTPARVG